MNTTLVLEVLHYFRISIWRPVMDQYPQYELVLNYRPIMLEKAAIVNHTQIHPCKNCVVSLDSYYTVILGVIIPIYIKDSNLQSSSLWMNVSLYMLEEINHCWMELLCVIDIFVSEAYKRILVSTTFYTSFNFAPGLEF